MISSARPDTLFLSQIERKLESISSEKSNEENFPDIHKESDNCKGMLET